MNLPRGDRNEIEGLGFAASGGGRTAAPPRNRRDASGSEGRWKNAPTLVVGPGQKQGHPNPLSGRLRSNLPSRRTLSSPSAGTHASQGRVKRQKLENTNGVSSQFFLSKAGPSIPTPSAKASSSNLRTSPDEPIVIDDDEDEGARVAPVKHLRRKTRRSSSSDPLDVITQSSPKHSAYAYNGLNRSPIEVYSSQDALNQHPQDGLATAHLRDQLKQPEPTIFSSVPSDAVTSRSNIPGSHPTGKSTARASLPPDGNVQRKVNEINSRISQENPFQAPPVIDLRQKIHQTQGSRRDGMRPKQLRTVAPLPIERVGVNPARAAGPSRAHKSSAVREKPKVVLHLPLEECAVGSTILSSGDVSEAQMGFFWEREDKRIKLRTGQGDIRLELVYGHRSLRVVEHVDEKDPGARPLIKISPLLNTAVDFPSPYNFKIGAPYPCGDLIFKFDATSKDWDLFVYETLVQDLVNCLTALNNRSILGQPAAKSLWEGVMNVQNLPMDVSEPEVDSLWVQQQAPRQPSKPKPRPEPRTEVSPNLYVRRSARLSGAETKRFSPRPDPDEVILCYRSGTGSLNITNGDVGRLKPGEFLNDTLIEFGLKLWLADLQQTDPELAAQIHVFSSFFYKKLSTKNQGYDSVRKWTSKFDLFQKKYVIVPINENLHWYLAIIYLPEYTLLPRPAEEAVTAPRRSTRRLGVVMDSSDAHPSNMDVDMDVDPPLSDPDPPLPPRSRSASFVPESPRTDDLKDESAVERLVKVSDISIDSPLKPEETLVAIGVIDQVEFDPEQHELGYPASDPPDGVHEQRDPSTSGTPGTSGTKSDGDSTPPIRTSGISPSNFYGTKESRRRNSIAPRSTAPVDGPPIEIEIGENETLDSPDSDVEDGSTEHPKTYIYTFDSLSSKHTSAIKKLSQYLLYEARDKKGKAEDTLTLSKGMQAIVPHQPNYCDCGIYLLHFAKTFMKDPKLSSDIIRNPQKGRRVHEHWDGASVGGAREELTARIMSMSEEWKKSRDTQEAAQKNQVDAAVPQEQNSGNATPAISANADGDSDSDIEVLVAPKKSAPASKVSRRGNGTTEPRKRGPATRVRG